MKRTTTLLVFLVLTVCCFSAAWAEDPVPVSGITLSESKLVLAGGISWRITAQVEPENAAEQGLVWRSSNINVAEVDGQGIVTANAPGRAVITVEAADGSGVNASLQVSVRKFDLVFESVQPRNVEYKIIPGKDRHITGHIETGCVGISEIDYRKTFEDGHNYVDTVHIMPLKAGMDEVSVIGTGNNMKYKVFVSPAVFPECGGALLTDAEGNPVAPHFLNLPWGVSYPEAKYLLESQGKNVQEPVMHDTTMRAQMEGKIAFSGCTATHAALDFAYREGARTPGKENELIRGLYYFDPETPFDQVRLAVRSVYGLDNGRHDETHCMWEKDGVQMVLEKKEKFIVLEVKKTEV